jgi:hypothetical protein
MRTIIKPCILFTIIFFYSNISLSQDLITKKSGEDIKSKVLEVTTSEIKFKKSDNLDGPIFSLLKTEVLLIRYENGTKDVFNEINSIDKVSVNLDMSSKGTEDALKFYSGKNSGGGWTGVVSALYTPIFGLIPAISCASSEPGNRNLNYPDPELMKNFQYNQAYKKEAHRIKKNKVWKGYGIGSGIFLVVVALLTSN